MSTSARLRRQTPQHARKVLAAIVRGLHARALAKANGFRRVAVLALRLEAAEVLRRQHEPAPATTREKDARAHVSPSDCAQLSMLRILLHMCLLCDLSLFLWFCNRVLVLSCFGVRVHILAWLATECDISGQLCLL